MDILDMSKIDDLTTEIIKIPGFRNGETVNVRVRKPNLLSLVQKGEIPNHLLGIAKDMILGTNKHAKANKDIDIVGNMAHMMELYGKVCLVEPTYEELKPYLTDEQGNAIFEYAVGMVSKLDSFRSDGKDDTNNSDGKQVQPKTE